jgi:hypothetical protein
MNKYLNQYSKMYGPLDFIGLELLLKKKSDLFFNLLKELEYNQNVKPHILGYGIELLALLDNNNDYLSFIKKQLNNKNEYIRESALISLKIMEDN